MHQEWRNLEIRNVYLSSHKETRGYLNVTNSAFVPFFHRWWLPLIRLLITGITWSTILPVSCFQCYYFQEEWHLRKIWGLHLFKGRCKLAVNICNSVSIFKRNTFQILSPWIRKQLHLVYLVFDSSHFKERQGLYPLIIVQACASKKKKKILPQPLQGSVCISWSTRDLMTSVVVCWLPTGLILQAWLRKQNPTSFKRNCAQVKITNTNTVGLALCYFQS